MFLGIDLWNIQHKFNPAKDVVAHANLISFASPYVFAYPIVFEKEDMTSASNDVIEKNILPESTNTKRQRGGEDEDSGGSEGASVGFEKLLKLLAALSLMCTYPMQLNAAYHYIADEFDIDSKKVAQYGLRALLVFLKILWKMASSSHDPLRMNILPAPVVHKRQRADEELTESASEPERVIEFNSALAYFLKVFMGCGIYAIPAAALISEIHFGISLIIGTYVIVALCLHILMKNANGCKSYPEFIKKTFDNSYGYFRQASKIFEIFVIIFGFGFSLCICSVYLIFIVTHICKVVYVWHYINPFEDDANELTKFEYELDAVECRWWIPMAATVLVILCFLPIWGKIGLYIIALVGAIFQMAVIILGFNYTIHYDFNQISVRQSGDLSNLFLVQSIAIYAGEGITTIFPLMAAMREPEKFLGCPSLLCSGMITSLDITIQSKSSESKQILKIDDPQIRNLCVLIMPGLVPFCTKSYGKCYWKAILGVLALGIGILLFVGGTIKNAVTWADLAYLRNKAT
uniref:Amino acid transporter transmembrane domain-containing protein n=1 Tax=Glossina austeni TaxID=7395 RepID=A0A1A9UV67_GLOAU